MQQNNGVKEQMVLSPRAKTKKRKKQLGNAKLKVKKYKGFVKIKKYEGWTKRKRTARKKKHK